MPKCVVTYLGTPNWKYPSVEAVVMAIRETYVSMDAVAMVFGLTLNKFEDVEQRAVYSTDSSYELIGCSAVYILGAKARPRNFKTELDDAMLQIPAYPVVAFMSRPDVLRPVFILR